MSTTILSFGKNLLKMLHMTIPRISAFIDYINQCLGVICAWLCIPTLFIIAFSVVERYIFNSSHIWQQEFSLFLHALIFLGCSSYTLQRDKHVRVDILYNNFGTIGKAYVNIICAFFFMLPLGVSILYFSRDFIISSWEISEKSREPGGLEFIYVYKSLIWLFAVSIILQTFSMILRNIITISSNPSVTNSGHSKSVT